MAVLPSFSMGRNDMVFTPKGLNNTAQGKQSAALGQRILRTPTLKGCTKNPEETWRLFVQPFQGKNGANHNPRVAEAATLGCDVKPLRGKELTGSVSCANLEVLN